jgi:hypothetical protein
LDVEKFHLFLRDGRNDIMLSFQRRVIEFLSHGTFSTHKHGRHNSFVLYLVTRVRVLTNDERNNHPVQCQGLAKNQHDEHRDEELVLIVTATDVGHIVACGCVVVRDGGIASRFVPVGGEQRDLTGPVSDRTDAVIAHNPNAQAGRETGNSAAQPGSQMGHPGIDAVRVVALVRGGNDRLAQNYTHNQTVDANHAGHYNRNHILHDRTRVSDSCVYNANARFPRPHLLYTPAKCRYERQHAV